MKKIITIILVLALCLSLYACGEKQEATTSAAPEVITFKLASNNPVKETSLEYQVGTLFCDLVDEYSGGTMKCEYYPAAQLGSSTEMVEGCSMGTIEMVMSLSFDLYANMEPSAAVMNMPYMFSDYDHMKAAFETDNPGMNTIKQNMIDNIDVRIMGYGYRAFRNLMVANKADVKTPADIAGMNVRSPEAKVNMEMISSWGASPVTITLSELYTAMQNGTVQAAENSVDTFYDYSFQDIVKSLIETDHMLVSTLLVANNSWYESLTPEQQEVIDKASDAFTDYTWEHFEESREQAWDAFEAAGVNCIRKDSVDIDAFREPTKNIYKQFVNDGWFTEDTYLDFVNMKY